MFLYIPIVTIGISRIGFAFFSVFDFFKCCQKFCFGCSYFRSIFDWFRCNSVIDGGNGSNAIIDRGNRKLSVMNGCNSVIDGCYGKFGNVNGYSGILNTESQMIGYIVDDLEFSGGIDVLVTAGYTGVSIAYFVFGRVDVAVTVFTVSEFILKFKKKKLN